MSSQVELIEPTKARLTVTADPSDLERAKTATVSRLSSSVKVPGFRPGKAPAAVAEKYLDANLLAEEALQAALNDLYQRALFEAKLHPVSQPQVSVKAYVPYDALKFEAELEVIGEVKLGAYRGLKVERHKPSVTAKDINEVLARLQKQYAKREVVARAAKAGDEVLVDFGGVDADSKQPISGASAKDYPLELGSQSFIPGFETELIGLKAGDKKEFKLTFPKSYQVAFLRGKTAEFAVEVKQVSKVTPAPLDDRLAGRVGDFKNLADLKADIRREVTAAKTDEAAIQYQNQLIDKVVSNSSVAIPESLLEDEVERLERDLRQNAAYRDQTWAEFLKSEGLDETKFKQVANDQATARVKAGLILGEIASKEDISVTQAELDERLDNLKKRYASDDAMQDELRKAQNVADIRSRLLVEKTIQRLEVLNK